MIRVKSILSSFLLAGALVTSPAVAGDDDAINSPEIQPANEQMVLPMSDMGEPIESTESFDVASLTYCWAGSVFDESSGESVDYYTLCQAELYDIA